MISSRAIYAPGCFTRMTERIQSERMPEDKMETPMLTGKRNGE
jgi:hypothetical protein